MSGTSRVLRLGLVALIVAVVVVGGYFGFRALFPPNAEQLLKQAEQAYAVGTAALEGGNATTAAVSFDQAGLQTTKALDILRRQKSGLSPEAAAPLRLQEGEAFWLRARALRDQAYAKAQAEDKPLPELTDSTTGEKFRGMHLIPDRTLMSEAVGCVRQAALALPKSPEVQREAIRTELFFTPYQWGFLQPLAQNIVELDPADTRARYLLARFEFEQPPTDKPGPPTPPEKRSRQRVVKAREHLNKLKETSNYPLWRTLHLEAQIDDWFARLDPNTRRDVAAREREEDGLRRLLLDDKSGALARAAAGEGFTRLSTWDVEGVLAVHLMAIEEVVRQTRAARRGPEQALAALDATYGVSRKLIADDANPLFVEQALLAAVQATELVQPLTSGDSSGGWKDRLDALQALARQAVEKKATQPALFASLAAVLTREAQVEGNRSDKTRQVELNKQALGWVEEGLRVGTAAGRSADQLAALHGMAAEMKTLTGAKNEEIRPHLEALRGTTTVAGKALMALLEGAALERQGRLDQARTKLELVVATSPGLALRAHAMLAGIYLSLGQPDRAVSSLREVEKAYAQLDQLSDADKAWSLEFMASPEVVTLHLVIAQLETARLKAARFQQKNPGAKIPADLIRSEEEAVARLLKKLKQPSGEDERARITLAKYFLLTGRREQAAAELAAMQKHYADSLQVLQFELSLLLNPPADPGKPAARPTAPDPKLVQAADRRIKKFVADNPRSEVARLFWADWLRRTQRAAEAVAYLQDPANALTRDERYNRILAVALLAKGDREESLKLLQHLPQDVSVEALQIQLAGSVGEREKKLEAAMTRHERRGLFLCWEAATQMDKRQFSEAAETYTKALEYTAVKPTAQSGLVRALFGYAQQEPAKARELATRLNREGQQDPVFLLAFANASLLLDEVGVPGDAWGREKNMAAALNGWEAARAQQDPQSHLGVLLTRAEFWALANNADQARKEIVRALAENPRDERVLRAAVNLALNSGEPELLTQAEKPLATLKELRPDDKEILFLQGQLEERQGRDGDALKTYQAILAKDPKLSGVYSRLVALLLKQGDKAKAATWVRQWREKMPEDTVAASAEVTQFAAAGRLAEARQLAERVVADRVKQAEQAPAPKAAGTDAKELEKQRREQIENVRLTSELEMARAFFRAEAYEESEAWLRRVLEKRPDALVVQLVLGDVYVARKDWRKARELYEKVLEKNKRNFIAINNLAWVLAMHLGDPARAYAVAEEGRKGRFSERLLPGDRLLPEFLSTLGVVYHKLDNRTRYQEMRALFEQARTRYPLDPRMALYLGHAYAGLGDATRAREFYSRAVALARAEKYNPLPPLRRKEVLEEAQTALAPKG